MHAIWARKWGVDIGVGDVEGRDGAQSVQRYKWNSRKFIRKLEDFLKVGLRYLVADSINAGMCLVGVSVAGYFLDQTHAMRLQGKSCIASAVPNLR